MTLLNLVIFGVYSLLKDSREDTPLELVLPPHILTAVSDGERGIPYWLSCHFLHQSPLSITNAIQQLKKIPHGAAAGMLRRKEPHLEKLFEFFGTRP